MLEPTKKPLTKDTVFLGVVCEHAILEEVKAELQARGCVIEQEKRVPSGEHEKEWWTLEEILPDLHAGHILSGARYREGMSQKRLSVVTGVSVQNISAMENGRRAIGKDVAKRFAEALHVDWRVFLR